MMWNKIKLIFYRWLKARLMSWEDITDKVATQFKDYGVHQMDINTICIDAGVIKGVQTFVHFYRNRKIVIEGYVDGEKIDTKFFGRCRNFVEMEQRILKTVETAIVMKKAIRQPVKKD